jgi:hypothetical protein
MDVEASLAALDHGRAGPGAGEKRFNGILEGGFVTNLDGGLCAKEALHKRGEIFHVRAENHWHSGGDGLGRILSASFAEALADEDNGRALIPTRQLASRIHKQHIGLGRCIQAGATGYAEPHVFDLSRHRVAALLMPRHEDQKKVGMGFADILINAGQDFLLAFKSAASEEHWRPGWNAE